ncbi:MAG: hypothetical protein LBD48_05955 [Treponema sp.]|nr:hypothetical protein [Treponema sp.]
MKLKASPQYDHIKEHIERMEKMRIFANGRGDSRKYLGAVAGIIFNQNEKRFALKCGLYVIEPAGDTFIVTAPESEYQPHEW